MADTVFDVLTGEHGQIKGLLDQAKDQPDAFMKFKALLARHVQAEEIVVYAPLKAEARTHEMVLEAFEEHHLVESVINAMDSIDSGSEEWRAKRKLLKDMLDHHIQEEEEELFPTGMQVLSANVIARMTQDYPRAEEQLVGNTVSMSAL